MEFGIGDKRVKIMVKFNKLNFLWVYLASINFSCVNNPSAACKVVETLSS